MTNTQWMLLASLVGMLVSAWMLWGLWATVFTFSVTIIIVHQVRCIWTALVGKPIGKLID